MWAGACARGDSKFRLNLVLQFTSISMYIYMHLPTYYLLTRRYRAVCGA